MRRIGASETIINLQAQPAKSKMKAVRAWLQLVMNSRIPRSPTHGQWRASKPLVRARSKPDDFAAARNFALDQAAGDWLLVLDADEMLDAGVGR